MNGSSVLLLKPITIGRSLLNQTDRSTNQTILCLSLVSVMERKRVDRVFDFLVIILVCVMSLITGMLLDISIIKRQLLETPILLISCCLLQYLGLPVLIYFLCRLIKFRDLVSTALFTVACSPISTKGNHWSIMFNADVELSVCLTFLSTLMSIVAMPAWIYTLGRVYTGKFSIPVLMLGRSILTLLIPYILGVLLNGLVFREDVGGVDDGRKEKIRKYAKVVLFFSMLFFITLGIYVSLPLFKLLSLKEVLIIPTFQWCGALIVFLIALIAVKLQVKKAMAIGLTCCYPNIGLAFLVVRHNLPAPETHIASAVVLIIAATGGLPLWIIYPFQLLFKLFNNRRNNRKKPQIYRPVTHISNNNCATNSELQKTHHQPNLTTMN